MDGTRLNGLVLSVNHTSYGVLFAAMIKGTGDIISEEDEFGEPIPFLTSDEILAQLEKFGFIIKYDVKSNLPTNVIAYLSTMYNLGYQKINRVNVRLRNIDGNYYNRPTVILMKDVSENADLLRFNISIRADNFNKKLDAGIIINISNELEPNSWDWLKYMSNLSDLLDENVDSRDEFETVTDVKSGSDRHKTRRPCIPESYPQYENPPKLDTLHDLSPEGYTIYPGNSDQESFENDSGH